MRFHPIHYNHSSPPPSTVADHAPPPDNHGKVTVLGDVKKAVEEVLGSLV
jgi:hypothetical protein